MGFFFGFNLHGVVVRAFEGNLLCFFALAREFLCLTNVNDVLDNPLKASPKRNLYFSLQIDIFSIFRNDGSHVLET